MSETKHAKVRTCTGDELEYLTQTGWELLDTRDEERQEFGLSYSTQETAPGGYPQYVQKQGPPVLVKRPVFVLGFGRDEEMALLREDLRLAKQNFDDAAKIRETAMKEREAAVIRGEKAEAQVEQLKKDLDRKDANLVSTQARYRKLEADLAKLRTEIGDARWREILGTVDASKPEGT